MPRYFFHLAKGKDRIVDDLGEDFGDGVAGLEAAKSHGWQTAYELARNQPAAALSGAVLLVIDAEGREVARCELLAVTEDASSPKQRQKPSH